MGVPYLTTSRFLTECENRFQSQPGAMRSMSSKSIGSLRPTPNLPDTSLWGDWRSSPPPSQQPLNLTTAQTPIDDHGLVSMDPLSTLSRGFEPYQQCRYSYPYHE